MVLTVLLLHKRGCSCKIKHLLKFLNIISTLMLSVSNRVSLSLSLYLCADPEGGRGPDPLPPPLKNYKTIGFLSNTGPYPL